MKNLIAAALPIICSVMLFIGSAYGEDEPLPPEVKKLIGVKVQTGLFIKEGAYIPNFIRFGSGMVNNQIGNEETRAELVFEEGLVDKKWPVFMVSAMHSNGVLEILDARLLPKEKINWRYENGKIEWLENQGKLVFAIGCQHQDSGGNPMDEGRIIFGLENPKVERDGMSTQIEQAWEIDSKNGHISPISTEGIVCPVLGGDD